MLKSNKQTRRSRKAIQKRWKQAKGSEEVVFESSDAELDEFDESWFGTFWIEGKRTHFDSNKITDGMQA